MIDPCIPSGWDGFTVIRKFRNATYRITVKNPDGVNKGIKQVTVDGKVIEGCRIAVFGDDSDHIVEVVMG